MELHTTAQLLQRFKDLGATRIFFKLLSENDNSKQQIYLGGSFEVLSFFPFGSITAHSDLKTPNFKAPLPLFWVDAQQIEEAKGTQLILYPKYPEIRLSGFLTGCKSAPSKLLQQIPKGNRQGADGRVMVFGTTPDRRTLVYLAAAGSALSNELIDFAGEQQERSLFTELTLPIGSDHNRAALLQKLREVHAANPHPSSKRNKLGVIEPYSAPNGGGYTLEALLGINPNGFAEPDYLGWEIKAYSRDRITLMTPEPDGGLYAEKGAKAFVEQFGHVDQRDHTSMYFTGLHKTNQICASSGLTMKIRGFDTKNPNKLQVDGAICLLDSTQNEVATWGFAGLIAHWNRKHAFAAYVPYARHKTLLAYDYKSPILMGEHTDFVRYLKALESGTIVFDPGSKVVHANTPQSRIKARSQFRIGVKNLSHLYEKFNSESILNSI